MAYPRADWRLILTPPADGAWNMAVDEAILEAVGASKMHTTLRLYAWDPPCLSLGYAQPVADADRPALAARGWDLVRRPTGGRAILHTDELTYAVIGPPDEPRLAGSVLESYRILAQGLLAALRNLGMQPHADPNPATALASDPTGPVCFEVPSHYEITVAGKKLVGSAQRRNKDGVLQHGSLPLGGDLQRIVYALRFERESARQEAGIRLLERATTAQTVLDGAPTWEQAAEAFCVGFSEALNLRLLAANLSAEEHTRAAQLVAEKYAHPQWTERT
jgi:lipoate-protein ligase A